MFGAYAIFKTYALASQAMVNTNKWNSTIKQTFDSVNLFAIVFLILVNSRSEYSFVSTGGAILTAAGATASAFELDTFAVFWTGTGISRMGAGLRPLSFMNFKTSLEREYMYMYILIVLSFLDHNSYILIYSNFSSIYTCCVVVLSMVSISFPYSQLTNKIGYIKTF